MSWQGEAGLKKRVSEPNSERAHSRRWLPQRESFESGRRAGWAPAEVSFNGARGRPAKQVPCSRGQRPEVASQQPASSQPAAQTGSKMALLNRFSKLNDRAGTGIFTFIVTKSVTRDFHRDATTKDFCFGYHRWAISFQRPTEKVLGVHLLLRNPSPSTACVVDFTLTLLNREHFSQNKVYTKRQAKFTITNPMQVSSGRLFSHLL